MECHIIQGHYKNYFVTPLVTLTAYDIPGNKLIIAVIYNTIELFFG